MPAVAHQPAADRLPFGAWLLNRKPRGDWVDELVDTARKDPSFPRSGDPETVRRHLSARGATGDAFEALDDAETDWLAW